MRKLFMIMILGLNLIGCTNLGLPPNIPTGQTLVENDKTTKRLTDAGLYYMKDHISLEKYYIAHIFLNHTTAFNGSTSINMSLKYYPDTDSTYLLFDEVYSYNSYFIKGILFSDRETVVDLDIKNLSNIIDSQIPNICLTKSQVQKLYKIISSSKPITARVTMNDGYFDTAFHDAFRPVLKEFLEVALKIKTYNIPE